MTTEATARIVVGVDGSDVATAALRWAVRQAQLTGARVEAVTAWHYPVADGWAKSGNEEDFESYARQALARSIDAVAGLAPDVPVDSLVVRGFAAEVLVGAAKGAELLVLGSRGHGRVVPTLLGSVSLHCVLNAHCSVLVLRPEPEEDRGDQQRT